MTKVFGLDCTVATRELQDHCPTTRARHEPFLTRGSRVRDLETRKRPLTLVYHLQFQLS